MLFAAEFGPALNGNPSYHRQRQCSASHKFQVSYYAASEKAPMFSQPQLLAQLPRSILGNRHKRPSIPQIYGENLNTKILF